MPDPYLVAGYSGSYQDAEFLARANPLRMLNLNEAMRVALRVYDEVRVHAARKAGATWQEIGEVMRELSGNIDATSSANRRLGVELWRVVQLLDDVPVDA